MNDAPVTMFIPFGNGYGNPGITLRADSLKELDATLAEFSEPTSDDGVSLLDSILGGVETVKTGVLLKFPPEEKKNSAPTKPAQERIQAPSDAPTCNHGSMQWREGTSKQGNKFAGWFCPAPHGANKCSPVWPDKR